MTAHKYCGSQCKYQQSKQWQQASLVMLIRNNEMQVSFAYIASHDKDFDKTGKLPF